MDSDRRAKDPVYKAEQEKLEAEQAKEQEARDRAAADIANAEAEKAKIAEEEAAAAAEKEKEEKFAKEAEGAFYPGDVCKVADFSLVTGDESAVKELKDARMSGDKDAINDLIAQGRLWYLGKGDKVLVLSHDLKLFDFSFFEKVRVQSGELNHKVVWISRSDLELVKRGDVYRAAMPK